MYFIELHGGIHKIIKGFHQLGFWHRGDKATVKETAIKIFYSIYYLMFPISLIVGALISENKDESILLALTTICTSVLLVRLLYILWRQKGIYELLNRIGVYSVKYKDDFTAVEKKLNSFVKWMTYFYYYVMLMGALSTLVLPFIGNDRKLFFDIAFPLDYKNNEIAYWLAALFLFTEVYLSVFAVAFTIIIWYVMINCGLKYKVLGNELRNIDANRTVDAVVKKRKIPEVEKRNIFNRDLIAGIESHKEINESMQQFESFLSELFSLQLATSAACICVSVYILAFDKNATIIEYIIYFYFLVYCTADVFMIMYFGNEIDLSSDALSYCLFQSNWMDQPQSCKKSVIIFGERLKQSHTLVVLKLYPLTLETFTRIMNGAYSMFNILKTLAM